MRILKRPMFRYGGPIKEGIMHGMRQSHKDGERVGLYNVGSPGQFKKTGGREHHYIQALAAVPWLLRAASIPFGRWATQQAVKKGVTSAGGNLIRSGLGRTRVMKPGETYLNTLTQAKNKFTPYKFWSQDPLYKAGATGAGWAGKGLKKGYQIAKAGVTTPSGIATTGGLAWMFWPDGTPKTGDALAKAAAAAGKKPGRGDEGMYYEKPAVTKTAAELAAEAKAARTKKLNKYLDTMGYDKAKKTAIGDALIDASAIVQQGTEEGGSLKHANWSKMINQAIQATSQRLKKPEQIREAVGLMMTKADIQKDMNADEKALAKLLTSKKIEKLNKELEGNSFRENLIAITQKIPGQAGFDAAAQVTEGVNFKGNLIDGTDWTDALKDMQEEAVSTGLNEKQLIKLYAEKEIAGKGYEDGDYTVGNNLVTIKDDIVVGVE